MAKPLYALSLQQPWAELILEGKKTMETRTWNTKFRGRFLIHASKKIDLNACRHFGIQPESLVTGALVGEATLIATKEYLTEQQFLADQEQHQASSIPFSRPRFGFLLENVQRIKPLPGKGALGFFRVMK